MEFNLDLYLKIPFKSTRYNKIGFAIPIIEQRKVKGNFRSASYNSQRQKHCHALLLPKLNSSFYLLKENENEQKHGSVKSKQEKIDNYLKRFTEPDNASKSKLMRDLDYRKQITKQMKTQL
ncbi:unnamed protein product (macronuclear) [Paramecium tetraurelia]|uniref:Uncharacterized protein n=1 Tax=Paramecium tetraurelia TaxID=5888 RepID=A0DGX5_PARTE|nr:uncharacterized protein GSPATT00002421001 [Paramecium tetraurelia]CAK82292.1 unnamed protein product [Paramecium tetraurelia]|eukprot:XP_001449689.1 hypothetical protein (macronuclear) [Paramecium tetraurelia strain d4-2]